jgi:hypothetical protein
MARRTFAPFAAGTVGGFYFFAAMIAMKDYCHFVTSDGNTIFAVFLAPKMAAYMTHNRKANDL